MLPSFPCGEPIHHLKRLLVGKSEVVDALLLRSDKCGDAVEPLHLVNLESLIVLRLVNLLKVIGSVKVRLRKPHPGVVVVVAEMHRLAIYRSA